MKLDQTAEVLVRAGVISPVNLAGGFPLWMPYGTVLAERFYQIYLEELGRNFDFLEMETPLLIEKEPYTRKMGVSYDYTNMFEVKWAGRTFLLRPDNLAETARAIKEANIHLPVVTFQSLYRSETQKALPLVRDRHIWRMVQVVHWVGEGDTEEAVRKHMEAFSRFLRRLSVAVVHVENPKIRCHSQYGIYSYAVNDPSEMSLVGTLYRIAPELTESFGLEGTLLDFGFSMKLLAVATALHSDRRGLILPKSLSPAQVAIGCRRREDSDSAQRLAHQLSEEVRVELDRGPHHQMRKKHVRRGTPVRIVADDSNGHHLTSRSGDGSERLPEDPSSLVQKTLLTHDECLWKNATRVLNQTLEDRELVRISKEDQATDGFYPLGKVLGRNTFEMWPPIEESSTFWGKQRRFY